jgi:rRNA maturation endonuclease Nob1
MSNKQPQDFEEAQDAFVVPVQCGSCYTWYDAAEDLGECPVCGSDEIVGDR